MSNPQTFYTVGGVDLSNIFLPYTTGSTPASVTGYTVTGYGDLNRIFAPRLFFTTGGSTVTYTNNIYVITFTTDGAMRFVLPPTNVNYLFVGGGGGGGGSTNNPPNGGGGGGGGGAGGEVLYRTNVFGSTPTMTLTFTVAVAPLLVTGTGANGNPTICSGPDITTITANGGQAGSNTTTGIGAAGGVGTNGGGSGGLLMRVLAAVRAVRISSSLNPRRRMTPPSCRSPLFRDPSGTTRSSSMMMRSLLRRVSM